MEPRYKNRYNIFGGIDKVLTAFKAGEITLRSVGHELGLSITTIDNDLKTFLGTDNFKKAKSERRRVCSIRKRIHDINEGGHAILTYSEALFYLENGSIKQIKSISLYKTIFRLVRPIIGKPHLIYFSASHRIGKIQGPKSSVKIRYAEPNENMAEYKSDLYRFKITPNMLIEAKQIIFCLKVNNKISYYLFPVDTLKNIQSLNLKFDNHDNSKYATNLVKVEIFNTSRQ
jgi:hypothetical protein